MRRLILFAMFVSAGLVRAVPAPAAVPDLGEFTTVSGDHPGHMQVNIPQNTWFTSYCGGSPDVTIGGTSRVPGIVLRKADGTSPTFPILRPPPESRFDLATACGQAPNGILRIPAGVYDLYLLTDSGGTATVTLHLHGLAGTATLTPSDPIAYEVHFPKPLVPTEAQAGLFSAGDVGSLRSRGMLFMGMWLGRPATLAQAFDFCLWHGQPSGPKALQYGPTCPTWSDTSEIDIFPNSGSIIWGWKTMPAGIYGAGGYEAGPFVALQAGLFSLWLSYS